MSETDKLVELARDLMEQTVDGANALAMTLKTAERLRDLIDNPPPYTPPTRPDWMGDATWAAHQLVHKAGDAAHWTRLLHIHIEDNNLADWFFNRRDNAFLTREHEYDSAEQWERDIFDALGNITEDERYQAVTGKPCPAVCYDDGCPYDRCLMEDE